MTLGRPDQHTGILLRFPAEHEVMALPYRGWLSFDRRSSAEAYKETSLQERCIQVVQVSRLSNALTTAHHLALPRALRSKISPFIDCDTFADT